MKKTSIFFGLLFAITGYTQDTQPSRIKVFNPQTTPPSSQRSQDSIRHLDRNCLKWNWSVLTRGVFLLNYERYLTDKLTLEIGLGMCYRDFLFELTKASSITNTTSNVTAGTGSTVFDNYGSPGTNICGEGGLRFYPNGFKNFEGIYFEGTVSYRPYTFPNSTSALNSADITPTGGTIEPGYTFLDYQVKFGYEGQPWNSDFTFDTYFGFAYRTATVNYYSVDNLTNGTTTYAPTTQNASFPQPLFGIKIGFAF